MKTPDVLLNLPSHDFDEVNRYWAMETTERELRDALHATRQEYCGISIQQIAEVIGSVLDQYEVKSLITALSHEDTD